MVFHLYILNECKCSCNHFSELINTMANSVCENSDHDLQRVMVCNALKRLFLIWTDITLLVAMNMHVQRISSDVSHTLQYTALAHINPAETMVVVMFTTTSHRYGRLNLHMVHKEEDIVVTLLRSFGFILINNASPSHIFHLMANVLKWWHGKVMFVHDASQDNQMINTPDKQVLQSLYTNYMHQYHESVMHCFNTYFSHVNVNEQVQSTLSNCILSFNQDLVKQIEFKCLTKWDIEGPDVSALLIAIARPSHDSTPNHEHHFNVVGGSKHHQLQLQQSHLMYLSKTHIMHILSFLRNKCMFNAILNHHINARPINTTNTPLGRQHTSIDQLSKITTHYYEDLLIQA